MYEDYQSGQQVTLSSTAIKMIRDYTTSETVTLEGVIEAYQNGVKIGESSGILISCSTKGNYFKTKINNEWKDATIYVRINNQWKEAKPYIRVNNTWKEGI